MLTASQIIERLGGAASIASELGLPLTTVASWGAVNFVPEWRREALLRLAVKQGEPLSTTDFPTREQRIGRKQAAA
jgi:hypothetical protein